MRLLVAEKPSVASVYKDMLEKAEGERFTRRNGYFESRTYWISWCVGHLVALADPEDYGWNTWSLDALPMIPKEWKYQVLKDTHTQFDTLRSLMKAAVIIINGTDAGREGELIYRLVAKEAGCELKPQWRLWLNSFVHEDMVNAWRNITPSQYYNALYASALCRAQADWLVGMNGSRGYSLGTSIRGLSVGRVQTPTLALIVARDREIASWQDRHFFILSGLWRELRFLYVLDGETKFDRAEDLERIKADCEGQPAELVQFEKNARRQNPPKPFDLSELQKAANRAFGMKAVATLEVAQALYEKKWVTYPRTDSQYLPASMKDEAWGILERVSTPPERAVLKGRGEEFGFFDSAKVTDHYAIIPTGIGQDVESLGEAERKVYSLIRSRFVLAFGKPYQFEEYRLAVTCRGHRFQARAVRDLDLGFRALYQEPKGTEDSGKDEPENRLKSELDWRVGERDVLRDLELEKRKATKPSHYTEATLLAAMETAGKVITDEALREAMKERGLGTPATKASIIEKLKQREYIESQGKYLLSTAKGRELIDLVDVKIASPEMTGEWEWRLNQIAKGKSDPAAFLKEIEAYVASLTASYTSEKAAGFEERIQADNAPCPKCSKGRLKENAAGVFCSEREACGFKIWGKQFDKKLSAKNIRDLIEKGRTGLIKGFTSRAGKKFDAHLKLEAWEVRPDFEASDESRKCLKCSEPLRSGQYGLYCKACGFSLPSVLAGRKLSEKEWNVLLKERRTAVLKGFKSTKTGREFEAALVVDQEFKVKFEF